MASNPELEAEEINAGFDRADRLSIRSLRAVIVAQSNGHEAPSDAIAKLIEIEETAVTLRARYAVLKDLEAPVRPDWLDPLS